MKFKISRGRSCYNQFSKGRIYIVDNFPTRGIDFRYHNFCTNHDIATLSIICRKSKKSRVIVRTRSGRLIPSGSAQFIAYEEQSCQIFLCWWCSRWRNSAAKPTDSWSCGIFHVDDAIREGTDARELAVSWSQWVRSGQPPINLQPIDTWLILKLRLSIFSDCP